MSPLEEEILKAITKVPSHYERMAEKAAQICKRHIEEALRKGEEIAIVCMEKDFYNMGQANKWKSEYLKSKGIE